jgi:hypothetical protein
MNRALSGQVFLFLLVAVVLLVASMQLGGQFDFITEIRDQLRYDG